MMKKAMLPAVLLVIPCAFAQERPEAEIVVEVEARAVPERTDMPETLFRDIPGVLLRKQGEGSPQADLSARGAPFNSSGYLLDGLALRNAQTEHWQFDVALPDQWLSTPALLTGLDRFRLSPGHPSGSVALELAPLTENERRIAAGGGEKGLAFTSAYAAEAETFGKAVAGASAFATFDHSDRTDAYKDNHLTRATGGGRISASRESLQADLLASYAWKTCGARGWYGTSPAYPASEDVRQMTVAGTLKLTHDEPQPHVSRVTALWRRVEDVYLLNRHDPAFYKNEHLTDFIALHGETRLTPAEVWSVDLRADGELEDIVSASLGDHTRARGSFAVLPNAHLGPLTLTAGGALDIFTTDRPAWLPATGAAWAVTPRQTLFASYTEAVRQPSYTELNYNSPASLGNTGLARQRTRTTELGWKGEADTAAWRTAVFYENSRNVVDWVQDAPGARWTAVNLEGLEAFGAAADGRVRITQTIALGLDALALAKTCDTAFHASRYAFDYPEASLGLTWRQYLLHDLFLHLRQGISKFERNPARQGDDWFWDTRVDVRWHVPWVTGFTLGAGASNLLGESFQVYPGQAAAGRRFYASAAYQW
ncbi:MAG: TonB-dependent receptor [Kiritimatiellaeota bacterium]|nr:TonB-dependent receptor [Kiritimatiellota bacterium]